MNLDDFYTASNSGKSGSTWHIFKKTSEENQYNEDPQKSLCGKYSTDRFNCGTVEKNLESLDSPPGIGKFCFACMEAVEKRLKEGGTT
ncbi:hypothetical protein SAMN05443574_12423 [Haloarcula vallismortis]|uniref:Uncharacterized protein n=2 Tax=Haloarcula vallismortis TaxID=28442 RepID=M0JLR2_HALVA|nr:hypothetical protein [Haloarcula vallismortis]EMA09946.1 hypothetical protein C437_04795 [Haloarcula vallismortis ATCC 29715]SDX28044.1 hypothetical protein SAMN05443574_12423 [Haloarcula vallismortis]